MYISSTLINGTTQLSDDLSVSRFYTKLGTLLEEAGLAVRIDDRLFDVPGIEQPFSRLSDFSSYQNSPMPIYMRRGIQERHSRAD